MLLNDIKQTLVSTEQDNYKIEPTVSDVNTILESNDMVISALESENNLFSYLHDIEYGVEILKNENNINYIGKEVLNLPAIENDSMWDKFKNFIKKMIDMIINGFKKIGEFIANIFRSLFGLKPQLNKKISKLKELAKKYQHSGRTNLAGEFPKHVRRSLGEIFAMLYILKDEINGDIIEEFIDLQKRVIKHDINLFNNVLNNNFLKGLDNIIKNLNEFTNKEKAEDKEIDKIEDDIVTYNGQIVLSIKNHVNDSTISSYLKIIIAIIGSCENYVSDKPDNCFYDLIGIQTNNIKIIDYYRYKKDNKNNYGYKTISLKEISSQTPAINKDLINIDKQPQKLNIEPLSVENVLSFLNIWERTLDEIDPAIKLIETNIDKIEKEINNRLSELNKISENIDNKRVYNAITTLINVIQVYVLKMISYTTSGMYATLRSIYSDYYIIYAELSMKLMTR